VDGGVGELQATSARLQAALGVLGEALASPAERELWRTLVELQQLEREFVERELERRVDALERVQEGLRRLAEVRTPGGVLARAPEELGTSWEFACVLVGRVRDGTLVPAGGWPAGAAAAAPTLRLAYPLVEAEAVAQEAATAVTVAGAGRRVDARLAALLGGEAYALAPLRLDGRVVGLVHAAVPPGRRLDAVDVDALGAFRDGLGPLFERAVLRERLRRHRRELRAAAQRMSGRVNGLAEDAHSAVAVPSGERLTPREVDVLRLMARGSTNGAIAAELVVAEGTVKFHVKNILRKLDAANRADAVSRYLRLAAGAEA
jgi:DNA-binding CsgD family transcriptional regulator